MNGSVEYRLASVALSTFVLNHFIYCILPELTQKRVALLVILIYRALVVVWQFYSVFSAENVSKVVILHGGIVCHHGFRYWASFALFIIERQTLVPARIFCISFCALDFIMFFCLLFCVKLCYICKLPNQQFRLSSLSRRDYRFLPFCPLLGPSSCAFKQLSKNWTSKIRFSIFLKRAILNSFHNTFQYNQPNLWAFPFYRDNCEGAHISFYQQYIDF